MLAEANLDSGGGAFTRFVTSYSEEEFVASGHAKLFSNLEEQALHGDTAAPVALGIFATADSRALHRSAASAARGTQPIMRDVLTRLPIPRLYVFGERSLPDRDYEALPTSGIEVAIVPEAGHGMTADNPTGFARVIAAFLNG